MNACETVAEFFASIDAAALWMGRNSIETCRIAIRLSVFARSREMGVPFEWDATHAFAIGGEFLRRVEACGCLTHRARMNGLLRATADTVLRCNLAKTHALRDGMGGNSPQRMRGNDKAMRRDIDREYHLHYWECEGSRPEFAAVGPHNCFDIPD